ncbi:hypothetical protein ACO0QE_000583 [Hanseniaspora vineae]
MSSPQVLAMSETKGCNKDNGSSNQQHSENQSGEVNQIATQEDFVSGTTVTTTYAQDSHRTNWGSSLPETTPSSAIPISQLLGSHSTDNLSVPNATLMNNMNNSLGFGTPPQSFQSFFNSRPNTFHVANNIQAAFPMTTANSPSISTPPFNEKPFPALSLPSLTSNSGPLPSNTDQTNIATANNYNNNILPDLTKLRPISSTEKKKRNKLIKSCLYCRSKKLKCDKKHPICGTCKSRELSECVYLTPVHSTLNKSKTKNHTVTNQTDNTLNKRKRDSGHFNEQTEDTEGSSENAVRKLKKTLSKKSPSSNSNTMSVSSHLASGSPVGLYQTRRDIKYEPNKILDLGCLTMKNERYMYFGATSKRASIINSDSTFLLKFFQGWKEFKNERIKVKRLTKRSVLQELRTIERDDGVPILERILADIPKNMEVIECCIDLFFKSFLHEYFNILSEQKVRSDIKRVFEIDEETGEITKINCTGKKNYYTVGVILVIISNTFYDKVTPDSLLEFYVFLEGFSTGKPMFIERAQFLGLKALYRVLTGITGGDSSHLLNVVGSFCSTVVGLGFHRNVYKIYEEDVEYVGGNLGILKNMFYLALFLDVFVSIQYGKPLFVSSEVFDEELLLEPEEASETGELSCSAEAPAPAVWKRRLTVLKAFLYHMRKVVATVYRPVGTPDIMGLVQHLNACYERIFLPLDKYFSFKEKEVDMFDYLLLPVYSQLQIALSSIQLSLSDEFTIYFQNNIIKHAFSTMKICAATIKRCYLMQVDFEDDNKKAYEKLTGTKFKDSIKPFILFALYVKYTNLMRSIFGYYKILYKTSTVIKNSNHSLKQILNAFVNDHEPSMGNSPKTGNVFAKNNKETESTKHEDLFITEFSLDYFSEHAMMSTKYSGLQLYKWFSVLSDVLFFYESKFFKATPKHFPDLFLMKVVENITKVGFDNFIDNLRDLVNGQISEVKFFESHSGEQTFEKFADEGKGSKTWTFAGFRQLVKKESPKKKEVLAQGKKNTEEIKSNFLNEDESKTGKTSGSTGGTLEAGKTNLLQENFEKNPYGVNGLATSSTVDHPPNEANIDMLSFLPENLDFFSATFNSDEFSGDLAKEIDKMLESFDFDDNNDFDTILNM